MLYNNKKKKKIVSLHPLAVLSSINIYGIEKNSNSNEINKYTKKGNKNGEG